MGSVSSLIKVGAVGDELTAAAAGRTSEITHERFAATKRRTLKPVIFKQANRVTALWSLGFFSAAFIYLALRVPEADFLLASSDQGYQMALGMAIDKGRLPGFDFITQYGPGVAFASYLGFAISGSVIGEMLLSTIGYSAAITIAAEIVRRTAGRLPALLTMMGLMLWFPRFYKWYYCLFPLVGLCFALSVYNNVVARRPRTFLLLGWAQFVGVAGMFRYDLGLEGIVFGGAAILAAHYATDRSEPRSLIRDIVVFACATPILLLGYIGAILVRREAHQVSVFARSFYDGAADTIGFYAISPFRIRLEDGFSPGNALAILQFVVPVTYVFGTILGIQALRSATQPDAKNGFTLTCVCLVGLGIYPQALHRADLQHLLQVGFPFVMAFILLSCELEKKFRTAPLMRCLTRSAAVVTTTVMLELLPGSATDLGPLVRNPIHQWQTLANLPESRQGNPTADMAMAIRQMTPSNAKVFLVMAPTDMALLFFAQRYQPGIFPVYERGMFSSDFWLRQNQIALRSSPPDFLVETKTSNAEVDSDPAPFIPDIVKNWKSDFTIQLYQNERYRLLAHH